MNCKAARTALLQAESLRSKTWPKDLVQHVDGCAACAKVARDLREIEDAWRDQPVPAPASKAQANFVKRHLPKLDPSKRAGAPKWLLKTIPWLAAAAMFLLAVGVFAWHLKTPTDANPKPPIDDNLLANNSRASTEVVDRIVDWHLELTNAEPDERKRLVEENELALRRDLQKAKALLSAEESELAEDFLDDGVLLASIDDPLEEANRAKALAEKILDKRDLAKQKGNDRAFERCGLHYYMFLDHAVNPLFERIAKMKPPDPKKDWKKFDFKKNPFFRMPPAQFQQKQQELRKSFDALRKKGAFRPGGFSHKK